MTTDSSGLLATSVFVAEEAGRRLNRHLFPDRGYVSVISLAELEAGVLSASTLSIRAMRLDTLTKVSHLQALEVNSAAARQWAILRTALALAGRRLNDLGGPEIIKV